MNHERSWHFCRNTLAQSYIESLKTGPQSLAIFAERRKGKTEFLLEDIMPLSEGDFFCCYINFWENKDDPASALIAGIERSIKANQQSGVWARLKKEVKVNAGFVQAAISQESAIGITSAGEAMARLLEQDQPILLLCDEVQHLATQPKFDAFNAMLRTFIESNKRRLRVIFTGSSQDNLNKLFKHQRAAFYNSASITPFPDLGSDFAEFLSKRFEYLSGRVIDSSDIMAAYVARHRSPAYIVELLQVMVREGIYSIAEGVEYHDIINPLHAENVQTWNELSPLDRELCKLLLSLDGVSLYHESTYQALTQALGVEVKQGGVQSGINRLRANGVIVSEGRGAWGFENSYFKAFVEEQVAHQALLGGRST